MDLQEAKEALDSLHPHKASAPLKLAFRLTDYGRERAGDIYRKRQEEEQEK
ncbi:TPA: hypothetical protein ACMDNU_003499 [Vibrio cholerae]